MTDANAEKSESGLAPPPADAESSEIVNRFHSLFYYSGDDTWGNSTWLGVTAFKCPLDLWIYQELLVRTRPDVIVECGTSYGGGAYFLASICDLLGSGRIITIDNEDREDRPRHPRITYLAGSSLAPETITAVRESIGDDETAMVILDSDHARDHVLRELRAYAPLVKQGHYLIVEDTNVNGHPVCPEFGPGPMEAVEKFLAEEGTFVIDSSCEKFFVTFNPRGFLRREADQARG